MSVVDSNRCFPIFNKFLTWKSWLWDDDSVTEDTANRDVQFYEVNLAIVLLFVTRFHFLQWHTWLDVEVDEVRRRKKVIRKVLTIIFEIGIIMSTTIARFMGHIYARNSEIYPSEMKIKTFETSNIFVTLILSKRYRYQVDQAQTSLSPSRSCPKSIRPKSFRPRSILPHPYRLEIL